MNGDRSHFSIRSSQTFIPSKSCLTLKNSCKYRMYVVSKLRNVRLMLSARSNLCQRLSRKYTSSLGGTTSGLTYTGTSYDNEIKMLFMRSTPSYGASPVGVFPPQLNSGVERLPGCGQLSTLEEQLVIIFTEMRGDDNNRLTVTINQAYKVRLFSPSRHPVRVTKQTTEGSER